MKAVIHWQDTIAAIATPPGVGALGIVRLSGPLAIAIADALIPTAGLAAGPSHRLRVGWLWWQQQRVDEVVVSVYKKPRSYTGDDVVEISCHGSPYVVEQILQASLASGARLANPGEFTQRAFLNGKLDLAQAEAVADLISSQSAAAHRSAVHHLRGGFSQLLQHLRSKLIEFSALIELELDFATEDVEFADRPALMQLLQQIGHTVAELIRSFRLGNVVKQGVSVAIIGKPNAGKSTLLNALLQEERAIVSDIPGTTRDTIEEVLNVDGILFRLIDTAGIRNSSDSIEAEGVNRSIEKMKQADLVVYLFDANAFSEQDLGEALHLLQAYANRYMLVANKSDLTSGSNTPAWPVKEEVLSISAKQGTQLSTLKQRLVNLVLQGESLGEDLLVTNARHLHLLQKINQHLHDITEGLRQKLPGDLLAIDIRAILQHLGEITGEITNDDQLDYIFSKFCIGK